MALPRTIFALRMGSYLVEEVFDVLLIRLRQGDFTAMGELYDRYSATLYGIALSWTDPYSAEQLVERTFLAIWKKVSTWDRSKGGAFAYLFGIMMKEARALSIPVDGKALISAFGLQRWANKLCPESYAVFEAIHEHGSSVEQTAITLKMPSKEVEARLGKVLHELLQHARS